MRVRCGDKVNVEYRRTKVPCAHIAIVQFVAADAVDYASNADRYSIST